MITTAFHSSLYNSSTLFSIEIIQTRVSVLFSFVMVNLFWNTTPQTFVGTHTIFGKSYRLYLLGFYLLMWRHIPEDRQTHIHRHEKLRSHRMVISFIFPIYCRVELCYNVMKRTEYFVSLQTGVVITDECNVMVNPSAWGHLNPSSYCDVGRLFYGVFKLWSKLQRKKWRNNF